MHYWQFRVFGRVFVILLLGTDLERRGSSHLTPKQMEVNQEPVFTLCHLLFVPDPIFRLSASPLLHVPEYHYFRRQEKLRFMTKISDPLGRSSLKTRNPIRPQDQGENILYQG